MRIFLLIKPKIVSFKNRLKKEKWKFVFVFPVGISFWFLTLFISLRLLCFFKKTEIIGNLLLYKFLSLILLTFFILLTLSNTISALSYLFLSDDLELLYSSPFSIEEIFLSRLLFITATSSWMLITFGSPVMLAYGFIYKASFRFFLDLFYSTLSVLFISSNLGILIVFIFASLIPAKKLRDIFLFLSSVFFVSLYLILRFSRPERLVNPELFLSAIQYIEFLKSSDSPYLPSYWMCSVLWKDLIGERPKTIYFLLLLFTPIALTVINIWVCELTYFKAYSNAAEAKRKLKITRKISQIIRILFLRIFGREMGNIMDKEFKVFFRDNTQWSQLLFLFALIVVYIYNFKVLPLTKGELLFLKNQIAYLNIGFCGFIISAISARFVFSSVSGEGRAFWIIRSGPISIKKFLWAKFLFYFPLLVFLGEFSVIFTSHLLEAKTPILVIAIVDTFFITASSVSMAIGFGASCPDFNCEKIAQVSTSLGGLLYMISFSVFLLIILSVQAIPSYWLFLYKKPSFSRCIISFILFSVSFFLFLFAIFFPIRIGERYLESL